MDAFALYSHWKVEKGSSLSLEILIERVVKFYRNGFLEVGIYTDKHYST